MSQTTFLADHNFNERALSSLLQKEPSINIVLLRDVLAINAEDDAVLAEAARIHRILLTHDKRTMPAHFQNRAKRREPLPGVFHFHQDCPIGTIVEELILFSSASEFEEWNAQYWQFPL